jgi:hypothetical protein
MFANCNIKLTLAREIFTHLIWQCHRTSTFATNSTKGDNCELLHLMKVMKRFLINGVSTEIKLTRNEHCWFALPTRFSLRHLFRVAGLACMNSH